jgi:hypothetical protein
VRVKVGRKNGLLKVAQFPVKSLKILSDGNVSLRIEMGIDVASCVNENVQVSQLDVYSRNIPLALSTTAIDIFSDGLRAATATDTQEKTRITNTRNSQKISTSFIDITKFIPNDGIRVVREGNLKKVEVVKTVESDLEILNSNNFQLEKPQEELYEDSELFCLKTIRLGKDPALAKGKFPLINPVNANTRFLSAKKEEVLKNFKIIGQSQSYERGYIETRFISCYVDVKIPRLAITNLPNLYFEIKLINNLKTIISIENFSISTQEIENDLKLLERSENINEFSSFSRTINQKLDVAQNPYVSLNSRSLKKQFEDKRIGTRIIRKLNGKRHVSSVITFTNPKLHKIPKEYSQNVIPFSINKVNDTLKIIVENIRGKIISIGVERRDATLNANFIKLFGENLDPVVVQEGSTIEFYDTNLIHNRIYEYRLFFIDDKGNVKSTSNILSYYYSSTPVLDAASIAITDVTREIVDSNTGAYPIVSFEIEALLTKSGTEAVKEFIASNGIDEKALGIPEFETESYKKLFVYQVDRQNLRTGEIETFGTIVDSSFVDDSASPKNLKTITPLNLLDSYEYMVKLGLRDPAALLPLQTTRKSSVINGKKAYDFRSYKFKVNPKSGIIPSNLKLSSLERDTLSENFTEFSLGIEASTLVKAEDYFPTVVGLTVRKTLVGFNLLKWSISGDTEMIDHFRIYAIADGIEAFIGASHAHITDGSYFYEDSEMYDRIGEVIYRVVPVLLNFDESSGESRVSILLENNLPTFLR